MCAAIGRELCLGSSPLPKPVNHCCMGWGCPCFHGHCTKCSSSWAEGLGTSARLNPHRHMLRNHPKIKTYPEKLQTTLMSPLAIPNWMQLTPLGLSEARPHPCLRSQPAHNPQGSNCPQQCSQPLFCFCFSSLYKHCRQEGVNGGHLQTTTDSGNF